MYLNWICPKFTSIINCLLIMCFSFGCSKAPRGDRKITIPVTGKVVVDGKAPSSAIKIICHDLGGLDQEQPSISWCMTGNDGAFSISTYETGDGVPPGKYALTFFWGKMNSVSMSYGGPDQLKGKYDEVKKSPVEFEVAESDEQVDLGTVELSGAKK